MDHIKYDIYQQCARDGTIRLAAYTIRIRYGPCRYDTYSIRSAADTIRIRYGQQPIRYVFDTEIADTIRIRYDTCKRLKDARSVSLYPYNQSQIMQYVKYTK